VQLAYLERFEEDVQFRTPVEIAAVPELPGGMTAPQLIARAESYGDAPWTAAQQVERVKMIRGRQYVEERRVHGLLIDDLCETCRHQRDLGWQPIGTLLPIGASECTHSCHCNFQYRDAQGKIAKQVRKMAGRRPRLVRKPVPFA
jgi:hypothetical protein